jgi:hypothetical protein
MLMVSQHFLMRSYPYPRSLPSFIFYDNACSLVKMLDAMKRRGDPQGSYFDSCGLPVDVFHFWCKHKLTDTVCDEKCNALNWPQLTTEEGSWRFNSSRAEQTNVWIDGYKSILREMQVDHYRFFLDEMVKRRNRFTVRTLDEKHQKPYLIPRSALGVPPEEDDYTCEPLQCGVCNSVSRMYSD